MIEVMNGIVVGPARLAAQFLGPFVLQASVVAAALLILERLRPHWRPEVRAGLLLIALVKFAVPPWIAWAPLSTMGDPFTAVAARAMSAVPSGVPLALGAVWITGSLVGLVLWMRARVRLAGILADSEPAHDPALLGTMDRAARRLGLARTPRLVLSERAVAPWVTGVRRPTVVVPTGWPDRLAAGDLAMILAHEVAHVRRRDVLILDIAGALATIWWWNPVFHAVRSRLGSILEEGCDDRAITVAGGDPESYCGALLRAARLAVSAPAPCAPPAGAVGMRARGLEERLRRALTSEAVPHARLGGLRLAILVVVGLALLPVVGRPALEAPPSARLTSHTPHGHDHAGRHQLFRHRH